ncbi:MAG TPA: LysR substrate-binding domain-containing protein, partial [Pseudolabrys sp.]|nr:LysR substrate-binding domain-containing protein [Pseudolabrys sp.]
SELDLPQVAMETNSLEAAFATLARTNYLASVPSLVLPEARRRGLTELNVKGSFWSVGLGYAHLRTAHLPSALATFITILRAHMLTLKTAHPSVLDA